jgi:hypothetical protein
MYNFYGYRGIKIAINKKLHDANKLPTPELQNQLRKLLTSFSEVIDAMSKNEAVNTKIIDFLTNIHNYAQSLPNGHKDKDYMTEIDNLMINACNNRGKIDMFKIQQQNVDEFIPPFIGFLNLNSDSNTLTNKNFRQFIFSKKDLNAIDIDLTKDQLTLEVESEGKVLERVIQLPETSTNNPQHLDLKIEYFRDFCDRAVNSNVTNDEIIRVRNTSLNKNSANDTIASKFKAEDRLFVNINSLDKIPLNTNYGKYTADGLVRDIDRIRADLIKMLPSIQIKVIDEKTNQPYMVEAVPETMVLFMGSKEVGGHYFTISIDQNGEIFIHNDNQNTTIEHEYDKRVADKKKLAEFMQKSKEEKLFEFIELQQAYPTNIGFRVVSKTPINK